MEARVAENQQPEIPSRVFVTFARVRYADTDQGGVAYHANYLHWFEDGRNEMLRELGRPYSEVERLDGVLLTVAEAALRYLRPAFYDDRLRIETRLLDCRKVRMELATRVLRDATSEPLATGWIKLACVDRAGKPVPLPPALLECLRRAGGSQGEDRG